MAARERQSLAENNHSREKDLGKPDQKLDGLELKKHCPFSMKSARARDRQLTLALLREQRGITQEKLAKRAKITQSEVSRTELRDDWRVSTLKRYITALGGSEPLLYVEIDGKHYFVTL